MRIKNRAKVSRRLINDVKSVAGSIYRMNAPYAIGYLFHETVDGNSIARGMFCDRGDDKTEWTYYLDFTTGILDTVKHYFND